MASSEAEDLAEQLGGIRLDTEDTEATTDISNTKNSNATKRARPKKRTDRKEDGSARHTQTSVKEATPTGTADSTPTYIPPHQRKKHGSIHINNAGLQSTAQLNGNATAFQPQALPFRYANSKSRSIHPSYGQGGVSLQQKTPVAGFNKASTRPLNGATKPTTGAAASTQPRTGRIQVPWMQRKVPRKHMMQRPNPTAEYLRQASYAPEELSSPRSLLVILDLNGTLLYREPPNRKHVIERPHMHKFLSYLLQHHAVMLWSSATPRSVDGMTAKIFDEASKAKLIDIWNRTHLRLPANAYNEKVHVYKHLSWVWENQTIQSKHPLRAAQTDPTASWSQADTVLIDDSIEKAASEPHNLIELEEFEAKDDQMGEDALGQVVTYLEKLRRQKDVSAYMRLEPFAFDKEARFDWASFFKDGES